MAKLSISEYQTVAYVAGLSLPIQAGLEPSIDQPLVDFTSGEAKSATFNAKTTFVRLWSDTDCCVLFGEAPTATTANKPLTAKTEFVAGVKPGQKVSVITKS